MSTRTEPTEAIERLAWALNYHQGESISTNKLAEKTGLSWATTKKYVQALEKINRISPDINVNSDGVIVNAIGDNLDNLKQEKDLQLVIYIIHHAQIEEGDDSTISKDLHADILEKYDDTLDEIEESGWIQCTDDTIRITPKGASVAGPAKSKYQNTNLERSSTIPEVEPIQASSVDEWEHNTPVESDTDWQSTSPGESDVENDFENSKFQRVEAGAATR
ncbi:winged helix-turn-helix transcriptional regulator [Halomicrobium katesii]|uniref:winged helix-turn-helix transcriptional regulator n=1 Tax=Halomicrobium katesii TaxID=437163 RepID=UPI0003722A06|nr:winged helix-turn-helix transcriptional regulator [Halomicrobium katesii]